MIAQQCKKCNEFIVVKVRADKCPFCGELFPEKKPQPEVDRGNPIELLKDAISRWEMRKPALATNKETAGHRAEIDKLLNAITIAVPLIGNVKKPVVTEHKVLTAVTEEASSDIVGEFVALQNDVHQLYNNVYGFLSKNNTKIKSKDMSNEELCDFGYISREVSKIFDELRKELNARMDLCGSIIALRLTKAALSDPTIKLKVVGQFASGTPDVKIEVALPKKGSPEYYQLTDTFGVPRDVAETGVLKLDWKAVTKYCTEQVQSGKNIPQGFGQQYPKYRVTYRKRKVN